MPKISSYPPNSSPDDSFLFVGTDPLNESQGPGGTTEVVSLATLKAAIGGGASVWHDLVETYGADPTGVTSASTALGDACTAAVAIQPRPFGLTVPPGTFLLTASQQLPWNMIMQGSGAEDGGTSGQFTGSIFSLSSGFTGSFVFGFTDVASATTNGCVVSGIILNGAAYTSGAVAGFAITGPVPCTFRDVIIVNMSGWAVTTAWDSGASQVSPFAQSWRGVSAVNCGIVSGGGFQLIGCEDSVFTECYAIGNGNGPGFHVEQCDNTKFTSCNSEWQASSYGFYITGDWQWFNGGCLFSNCSTDANGLAGVAIDATWTTGGGAGTGPGIIQFSNLHCRRDGCSGSSPSTAAGIYIGATTLPVIITSFATYPNVGDGGGGSLAPAYGLQFSQTSYAQPVLVANGLAWGATAAYRTGSTNNTLPTLTTGATANILLAHGAGYTPTYGS